MKQKTGCGNNVFKAIPKTGTERVGRWLKIMKTEVAKGMLGAWI